MKAVYYSKNGSPDVLEYGEVKDPQCKDDGIIIRVKSISLEGGDLLNRRITPPAFTPFIGGYQVAGIIEEIGTGVTRFKKGDRVTAFNWYGSHAEYFACPEFFAYGIPDTLSFDHASTIPVSFGTAHDSLFEFGRLQKGETVLIQGATGGVGIAAVQLASQAGAIVIGTGSNDGHLKRLKKLGLDHGINYRTEQIDKAVHKITGGKGADLIVDLAGGKSIDILLKSIAYRGRFAVVGASSGDLPVFKFFDIIRKSLSLYGISFGQEMHTPRAHNLINELINQMNEGTLQMPIEKKFPLQEMAKAHHVAEEEHPFGRIIITP